MTDWFKVLAPIVYPSAVIERALAAESIQHLDFDACELPYHETEPYYHGGKVTHMFEGHCREGMVKVCERFVEAVTQIGFAQCGICGDTDIAITFIPISASS